MAAVWRIPFRPGDDVPWFTCASPVNPNFHFSTLGGRYVILSFLGNPDRSPGIDVLGFVAANANRLLNEGCVFFGVIDQPSATPPAPDEMFHFFHDFDRKVANLYRAIDAEGNYHPFTLVLDTMLRVLGTIPVDALHNERLATVIGKLPPIATMGHAPVLVIPRIFEPDFCKKLIGLYQTNGGTPSGTMRAVDGKTVAVLNPNFKRRKDFPFDEQPELQNLRDACDARLSRRLLPQIFRAFQFKVSRIERYVVAHYSSEDQGFFNPHRDNTTPGTAHRRFACTINLNAEEFEGGELRFPEFGHATYRAPTGGAVIFSCSLMHEATPVTKGERYAFLPFFYNEETVDIRREGSKTITKK